VRPGPAAPRRGRPKGPQPVATARARSAGCSFSINPSARYDCDWNLEKSPDGHGDHQTRRDQTHGDEALISTREMLMFPIAITPFFFFAGT
jgi:hypothetical protein